MKRLLRWFVPKGKEQHALLFYLGTVCGWVLASYGLTGFLLLCVAVWVAYVCLWLAVVITGLRHRRKSREGR